ncbi:hypothetical protein ABGN05_24965 [Aquibium sp. LZ166]|uniref:Uncharacterized protein n=1 Tax=Aquibium pacificus TaxID=3153579 RepID=A0ABV3SRG2_9HYPH
MKPRDDGSDLESFPVGHETRQKATGFFGHVVASNQTHAAVLFENATKFVIVATYELESTGGVALHFDKDDRRAGKQQLDVAMNRMGSGHWSP